MKNILNEEINRIKSIMGLIVEGEEGKISILLDGTSSAGKSHTSKLLNAVPLSEATDPNQWVIIGSDDFSGVNNQGEKNRLKLDPPSIRDWAKEEEESGIVSGLYRKDGKDVPPNPKEHEYIEDTDPRVWYMAEEYKTGPWKKVIFDDIGNQILKYVPNVKHNILLHAPLYILLKNVSERNKMGDDSEHRDPKEVLVQYLEKYEASKQIPDISKGDPTTELTYKGLVGLLSQSIDDKEYIKDFLTKLGIQDSGVYYIKIKDQYLTSNTQLINVDSDRKVYLDKFKDIVS